MTTIAQIAKFGTIRVSIPTSHGLAEVVGEVISDWAFLSAVHSGKPAPGPAPLDLEFSVSLRGPLSSLLVLRADKAFGAELAHASTGDPGAREQAADAFRELCNMVASHLLTNFFGGREMIYDPFVPVPSLPERWPDREPTVECVMLVEHFPVEARLWIDARAELSHE
ncbi:MAG TPA: hypothetical protein VK786_04635 [bacterium]|nr:hypothetical protein [bacterium]